MQHNTVPNEVSFLVKYSDLDNQIRTQIDSDLGIKRKIVQDEKAYPTGSAVIRDATSTEPINAYHESRFSMEVNNMLLRVLGRLRGIDYALMKQAESDPENETIYSNLRRDLSKQFDKLTSSANEFSSDPKNGERDFELFKKFLYKYEERFNTEVLCNALYQAHLDEGCSSQADYEKLLFHYRNLSALIEPAKTLITICYDDKAKVIHRIRQDPIAKKLPQQGAAIAKEMSETCLYPSPNKRNFQTSQKMAMQIANSCFADLAGRDDRMLGAQTRKTHMHGAKNAFFVTNELVFGVEEKDLRQEVLMNLPSNPEDVQYFVRSATPVYIGGGETERRVQEATRANIEQIRRFAIEKRELTGEEAQNLKIHYTCLVTDSPLEGQDRMIHHAYQATRYNSESQNDISYIPTNWDGTHRRLDLATKLEIDHPPSTAPTPSNQAARYRQAVQVSVSIRGKQDVCELVTCASGQDRTGGETEAATLAWVRERYKKHGITFNQESLDPEKGDSAEQARAKGRNAADLNGHLVGGSPGCKKDSCGRSLIGHDHLFAPETEEAMYLDVANTNKSNKVDKSSLKACMTSTKSEIAEKQYIRAMLGLEAAYKGCQNEALWEAGKNVYEQVSKVKDRVPHQDLGILIRTVKQATEVLSGSKSKQVQAEGISRLGVIAKELNKKSLLKKVGGALLVLGGVALVAAGILFAIPSGGGSLLAAVLGAKAIAVAAVTLGLQSTIAVGASSALVGATATYAGNKLKKKHTRRGLESEHGLIKAITELDKQQQEKQPAEDKEEADYPLTPPRKAF